MTKTLAKILFIIYSLILIWIILFKLSFHPINFLVNVNTRSLNLVPFALSGGRREVLLNVFIFVPFGVLLNMVGRKIPFLLKFLIICAVSFLFESLQYLLSIGASDVTDLITNSLGGLIGLSLYSIAMKLGQKRKVDRNIVVLGCIMIVFIIIWIGRLFFRRMM
ncbi:VanZ family protein [Lactococcus allomyrinae]|uniref:VanZ family protein n=1 Tax=Lactococcus allomyrinae TaxID=2419773 RepID=A0A387BGI7_9LACT|nr:VanZ family protein [Lactococcus allomyrinae]AYG00246.1 VanZ family protein [Lactococcus allomyrinae]